MAEITLNEHEVIEDMGIADLKIVQNTRLYRFTSDSVLLSRFATVKKRGKDCGFLRGERDCGVPYARALFG